MQIKNQVADAAMPWFMAEAVDEKRLAALNPEVRQHVQNVIRDGYTIIKGSVPKAQCKRIVASFKHFAAANGEKFSEFLDADGHYPRIINLHAALPDLFQLFSQNPVTYQVQAALFGAEPCLYTSLFYERGSAQPIHRDTPYFSTQPEYFYLGVWTALEDASEQNGALEAYVGGHKVGEADREAMALKHFDSLDKIPNISDVLWNDFQADVVARCEAAGLQKKLLSVSAGDTVIWHPQLPLGGSQIKDITRSRFSLVMHTTPLGVPVYNIDKFMNPRGKTAMDASYDYEEVDGCHRVRHGTVDIGHRRVYKVREFNQPPPEAAPGFAQSLIDKGKALFSRRASH